MLGKESFRKFTGSSVVAVDRGPLMNCNATEETKIVSIDVERKDSVLVAKPIRKAPEPQEQRLVIQDDLDIEKQGLFVSPLGVGSALVLETQLFLLFHLVVRRREGFKPGRRPNGLVVRKLLSIYHVSQLNLGADLEHEARFNMLNNLVLDLLGDGAFQMQVETKQECSPALFHSMLNTLIDLVQLPTGFVQGVKLFHNLIRKAPRSYKALLFVEPLI